MKVYLASWFASKDEMNKRAADLRAAGIEVTSRWLEEKVASTVKITDVSKEYLRETARVDIEDILQSNMVVLNVPSESDLSSESIPVSSWARGGRHFEAGFQYATMMFYHNLPMVIQDIGPRYLILVGHKENVFHHLDEFVSNGLADKMTLPAIDTFETWEQAKETIIKVSDTFDVDFSDV